MALSLFETWTRRDMAIPLHDAGESVSVGGRSVKAIFTDGFEQTLEDGPYRDREYVTSRALYIDVSEIDFPTIPVRGTMVYRGTMRYTIREIEPEGLGLIRCHLNESDLSLPFLPEFSAVGVVSPLSALSVASAEVNTFSSADTVYLCVGSAVYRLEERGGAFSWVLVHAQALGSSRFAGGVAEVGDRVYYTARLATPGGRTKLYSNVLTTMVSGEPSTSRDEGSLLATGATEITQIGTAEALWSFDRGTSAVYESRNLSVPPEANQYSVAVDGSVIPLACATTVQGETFVWEEPSSGAVVRCVVLRDAGRVEVLGSLTLEQPTSHVRGCTVVGDWMYVVVVTAQEMVVLYRLPVRTR